MTSRIWIVAACGGLLGAANVGAQSDASTSPYVNADTGITLDAAVAQALGQEPALRATRTEVDAARGARVQARLHPNPMVSFMQQQEPGGADRQSRIEVQWPLDLFRKTGRVAVADRTLEAADRGVSDRERTLAAEVRSAYGELAAAVRDLSVSGDLIAAVRRQRDLLGARVDQGVAPPIDRNVVEVELRRLEADRLLQAGQLEGIAIELKRLLGLPARAPLQLRDTIEELVTREGATPPVPEPAAAASRPDVQAAEARIRLADAQIDRARREGRFDLSVFGSYMRMDAGFPQLGLDALGQPTRIEATFHYLSAGAALTVPLRNKNQGEVASAEAERAGAAARLSAARLAAEAEIATAAVRDQRAREALAVYRGGARDLARQNLDVVTRTYELGRATVFDVLSEQRRYLELERAYSAVLRESHVARTALRRALGDVR